MAIRGSGDDFVWIFLLCEAFFFDGTFLVDDSGTELTTCCIVAPDSSAWRGDRIFMKVQIFGLYDHIFICRFCQMGIRGWRLNCYLKVREFMKSFADS